MTGSSTAAGLLGEVTRPARRHDPYPLWARLRENRVSVLDDGSYALGRYADVVALLHDPRLSSDPHSATDPGAVQAAEDTSFIRRDPPEHDRLRAAVTRYFGPPASPRVVAGLEPVIGGLVDDLLDALPPAGEADLVGQFAYPLPVSVITGLLGVPSADEPRFRAWTDAIVAGLDAQLVGGSEELLRRRDAGLAALAGYMVDLARKHRAQPDGSMLSNLANDHDPGAMSEAELGTTGQLLLVAGHETTVNLVANGILTLLRNPWALERLRAEPSWVIPVVEEVLRFEPPVQYLPQRFAHADIAIDGTTIPRGAQVVLLLAAANRDPERFAHPDRFDPGRGDNAHLGFGSGLHYCFGAPLARVEAHACLAAFAKRFLDPALVADPPPYRQSAILRGPARLAVRWTSRSRARAFGSSAQVPTTGPRWPARGRGLARGRACGAGSRRSWRAR